MNDNLRQLANAIHDDRHHIIAQWTSAVAKLPRAKNLEEPLLTDHMPELLEELSGALTEAQKTASLVEMSAHRTPTAHGAQRFKLGFDVEEVVAEFNILREVLQRFAEGIGVNISGEVNLTINRVIDKAMALSLEAYVRNQSESADRQRRQHLSFVVHDLKTPISAMATATHVIERNLGPNVRESTISSMLELLRRNAERLNNLVMEIINRESSMHALTRDLERLQIEVREIDFWPVAERLKQDCQSIASSRHNTIRNEAPQDLRVYADPDLLLELLQNLLSNALQYTENGEVVIGARPGPDATLCWVRDTGIGIPPDRQGLIFDEGTLDSKVQGSTGLGLAIAKKVMRLHGGTISVESAPGKGSTFYLSFPINHKSRSGDDDSTSSSRW